MDTKKYQIVKLLKIMFLWQKSRFFKTSRIPTFLNSFYSEFNADYESVAFPRFTLFFWKI